MFSLSMSKIILLKKILQNDYQCNEKKVFQGGKGNSIVITASQIASGHKERFFIETMSVSCPHTPSSLLAIKHGQ